VAHLSIDESIDRSIDLWLYGFMDLWIYGSIGSQKVHNSVVFSSHICPTICCIHTNSTQSINAIPHHNIGNTLATRTTSEDGWVHTKITIKSADHAKAIPQYNPTSRGIIGNRPHILKSIWWLYKTNSKPSNGTVNVTEPNQVHWPSPIPNTQMVWDTTNIHGEENNFILVCRLFLPYSRV